MDTAQWPQGGIGFAKSSGGENPSKSTEKKPRPQKEQALNCPRCNSTNTKFCYYNNYSLSQPRYFCKTCRRYWTEGGSLRNVPVGGGSRKNKRSSSINSTSSSPTSFNNKKFVPTQNFSTQNPKIQDGQDLNLAYNPSHYNGISEFGAQIPVMELFKSTGNIVSGGFSSLISAPDSNNTVYSSSAFSMNHDLKPGLGFSVDGFENYGNINQDHANSSSRVLFPFEELKPVSNEEFEENRGEGGANGFWNGMLAGGSW